jgi:hypothetical protein
MNEANVHISDAYVVYDHPSDYPNEYVVRRWELAKNSDGLGIEPKEIVFKSENLSAIREHLSQLFLKIGIVPMRFEGCNTDPKILEEWI